MERRSFIKSAASALAIPSISLWGGTSVLVGRQLSGDLGKVEQRQIALSGERVQLIVIGPNHERNLAGLLWSSEISVDFVVRDALRLLMGAQPCATRSQRAGRAKNKVCVRLVSVQVNWASGVARSHMRT